MSQALSGVAKDVISPNTEILHVNEKIMKIIIIIFSIIR